VPTDSAGLRFVEIGSIDIDRSLDFYRWMSGWLVTDPYGVPLQAVIAR
jgi:hypothetical protein